MCKYGFSDEDLAILLEFRGWEIAGLIGGHRVLCGDATNAHVRPAFAPDRMPGSLPIP